MTERKQHRRMVPILLTLLALYVLFALAVMLAQRRLIYFPTRLAPEVMTQLAQREGFQPWHDRSGELIGWHLPARASTSGAVLVLHGNAGCAAHRSYFAQPIHAATNVDVFVLEYPGYGCRSGSPSQASILAAAEEAFESLTNHGPVYVVGESLGTGAAAHLAQKHPSRIAGLALFAPYDRLTSVGQRQMPFLPVRLLMWDRFNPAESLKHYRGPVKVVLAQSDTIIPPQIGQRLFDGYSGPKSLDTLPGGHNDIAAQPPEWWRNVFAFWSDHAAR